MISNRYSLIGVLALFILVAACVYPQNFVSVRGTGMAQDRDYDVSGFHGIDVSGGFDVTLIQGNSENVTITAQENLFEYIRVEVNAGVLEIYTDGNIWPTEQLEARIELREIDMLEVSGGGDVVAGTPLSLPALDIRVSGGGDIAAEVNTGELDAKISGGGDARISGDIEIYNVEMSGGGDLYSEASASMITCTLSGGGDVDFNNNGNASDIRMNISGGGDMFLECDAHTVRCSVSGGGDAELNGSTDELEVDLRGGGDLQAQHFNSAVVTFDASGGSDLHVHATDALTGRISGGGNVYYSGDAGRINIDASGGSEVRRE